MIDAFFPPEVPEIGDLVRITPVTVDYVVRNYKFFCQEAFVSSRFYALDYNDRKFVEVWLSGDMIRTVRFSLANSTWSTDFDEQTTQLEIEKIG
jgi:hypothetical protein